ncbi:hypothetical protein IFU39_31860 [Paenibacillus sp. CFBP 13594]|uniref:hypothetical protein n=1 Tax=Paenibacillus sp. CFBP 13594 TaxID=2774037 RepID=UPI00177C2E66|nr:hypothetical protein [Paenibacillus sp. CFBP 13594]MBD8842387.1 hypothetical protein [Paenibacillus sp. CFBP 13594]
MKNRIKYIWGISIIIVFLAIAVRMYISGQYTMYIPSKHTTFRAEVTDHMTMLDTLDRLTIRKISDNEPYNEDDEITITDPKEIRDMLKLLKDVDLKRVGEFDVSERNPHYYEWRLTIKKEGRFTDGFGLTFYNEKSISIYSEAKTRDKFEDYEITNEFNLNEMDRLFEKLKEEQT